MDNPQRHGGEDTPKGNREPGHVRRILKLWVALSVICVALVILINPLIAPKSATSVAGFANLTDLVFTALAVPVALFVWLLFFATWSPFTVILVLVIAVTAVPRIMALRRGIVDPRFYEVDVRARIAIAAVYFLTVAVAVAGTVASHIDVAAHGHP